MHKVIRELHNFSIGMCTNWNLFLDCLIAVIATLKFWRFINKVLSIAENFFNLEKTPI